MRRSHTWLGLAFIVFLLTSAVYADLGAFAGKWKFDKEQSRIPKDVTPYEAIVIRMDSEALVIVRDGVEDQYRLNGKASKSSKVDGMFLLKTTSYFKMVSETSFLIHSRVVIGPSAALKKMGGKITFDVPDFEFAQNWVLRNPTTLVMTDSRDDRELIYIKE